MVLKLGRKPALRTRKTTRTSLVMAQHLGALGPPPPASNDYTSRVTVPWGMFLNDQLGDCVCADTAHALMLRTACAGTIVVPSDADVEYLYEKVGGYDPGNSAATDNGCVEVDMCQYLETTGFLGHKSDATGTVEVADLDLLRWCVQLFGTCRIGVNFPNFAMDQFQRGVPWDATGAGDQTVEGGHDVPLVGYAADGTFACVTWGKIQRVTPAFLAAYCEEAHAELFFDWINSQGVAPSGLDLNQLAADLQECSSS